jgi:hypothetical protein
MMNSTRYPARPIPSGANTERVPPPDPCQNRAHFRIEKRRSWGPISARIVNRTAGEANCRNNHHRLTYFMTDFEGTIHADETLEWKWALSHGTFAFQPAGSTLRSNRTAGRYIQILQSGDTYANLGLKTVLGGRIQLESKYGLSDPLVSQIVLTIAKEIKTGLLDHILVDALNTALAVQISRLCGNPPRIAPTPSNGLSR